MLTGIGTIGGRYRSGQERLYTDSDYGLKRGFQQ